MSSGSPGGDEDQPLVGRLTECVRALVAGAKASGLLPADESERRLVSNLVAALLFSRRADPPPSAVLEEVVGVLMVRAVRFLALGVTPPTAGRPHDAGGEQEEDGYWVGRWSRPLAAVGGDVLRVTPAGGRVWALVADITGHGLAARAVAIVLERVWDAVLSAADADADPPAVGDAVEGRLAPHLPEGVFVEAAVVRATGSGRLDVLAAGAVRAVVAGSPAEPPAARELGGHQFGLPTFCGVPAERDVAQFDLAPGGQLLFGTDGLFEHPLASGAALKDRLPVTWADARPPCLHAAVVDDFTRSAADRHDDAAALTFRRLAAAGGGGP